MAEEDHDRGFPAHQVIEPHAIALADTTSISLNVFDVTFVSPTNTDRPSAQGRQPSENGLIGSHSPQISSSAARRGCIAWRRVDGVKAAPAARASATITRRSCICSLRSRSCGCHRHTTVSSVALRDARAFTDKGIAGASSGVADVRALVCSATTTARTRARSPGAVRCAQMRLIELATHT